MVWVLSVCQEWCALKIELIHSNNAYEFGVAMSGAVVFY